MKCIRSS